MAPSEQQPAAVADSAAAPSVAEPRPAAPALEGLRVLDLSDGVAGQFCGRLMADQGASVLLVEAPGGTATRRQTGLFENLNAGKLSVTSTVNDPWRDAITPELTTSADVIVADRPVAELPANRQEHAIVCQITPFGAKGSHASWRGGELVYQAYSGVMYQNGRSDREPLYGVGHRASYAAGTVAYVEALALLIGPTRGHTVDVSVAEVATSMNFNLITQFAYSGDIERRSQLTTARAMIRCSDGWAAIFIRDARWLASAEALGFEDLIDDPRYVDEPTRLRHWDEFQSELGRRLADRTTADVVQAAQDANVAAAQVFSPLELLSDPQLEARDFWRRRDGDMPDAESSALGPMFRLRSDRPVAAAVPDLKQGGDERDVPRWTGENRGDAWGRAHALASGLATPHTPARPLAGLRVMELTTAWSGPMASRFLATLGAEVLKVEAATRLDEWRGTVTGSVRARYPDAIHGLRPYNRNCQFNTQNVGKLGIAIDVKADGGRELLFELAAECDLIITNFRPGFLGRIGITQDRLCERNPRVVVLEMSGYGEGGPVSNYLALGPGMESMAGMAALVGYGDGRPYTTGPAYLDPIGAMNGAAAALTAILSAIRTGRGQRVELAQREAAMHWIGEEILRAVWERTDRQVRANRSERSAVHDAFPAAGEDRWIVIDAETDEEFAALVKVMGQPQLLVDPRFATPEDRFEHADELHRILSSWTIACDKQDLARELQRAGVPAAPVNDGKDLYHSDFLRERGMLEILVHPEAGRHVHQGLPLTIDDQRLHALSPAPLLGQHTEDVLRRLLGLSADELRDLHACGVTNGDPGRTGGRNQVPRSERQAEQPVG